MLIVHLEKSMSSSIKLKVISEVEPKLELSAHFVESLPLVAKSAKTRGKSTD